MDVEKRRSFTGKFINNKEEKEKDYDRMTQSVKMDTEDRTGVE
jgi:hypothetical protein